MSILSEELIASYTPTSKTRRINDGNGLYIEVRASGNKIFVFRFQWNNRPQTITIGKWPAVSLNDARIIASKFKTDMAKGLDPRFTEEKQMQIKGDIVERYLDYLVNEAPHIPMSLLLENTLSKFLEMIKDHRLTNKLSPKFRNLVTYDTQEI